LQEDVHGAAHGARIAVARLGKIQLCVGGLTAPPGLLQAFAEIPDRCLVAGLPAQFFERAQHRVAPNDVLRECDTKPPQSVVDLIRLRRRRLRQRQSKERQSGDDPRLQA
jgi:hypothetical protein